ncbi:MAG: hypothetical protein CR991_09825 [Proteobacteria bacterium]|nr:MAG: hypothetical protein CR991_09825 [Pseudomonadota bacterium]
MVCLIWMEKFLEGQITIPKDIRSRFNLQVGDRLEFIWVGEELRVRPV